MHPLPPTADTPSDADRDQELTIILAEYGHQYDRQRAALDGVNQALTLYLSALGFVAPLAGAVAVFSQNPQINPFVIAGLMAFASAASMFTLFRTYKARIEQIYAEKSLVRLRNYFVAHHPDLRIYLPGYFNDDWPTPFSHRWRSLTFYGWSTLSVAAGVFAALAVFAFMWGLPYIYQYQPVVLIGMPVAGGLLVFWGGFVWLWTRLNAERRAFIARFPQARVA